MISINESQVLINFKEYSSLKTEIKEEIEKNLSIKLFMIKFTNDLKYNIKVLKRLKKKSDRIKYCGIEYNGYKLIGIVNNENEEIISCIKAIFIENRDERYEYIYDTLCKQLDQLWNNENPCKFENNICISERSTMKNPRVNGCCYAFWYKNLGSQIVGVHQCEHLHPTSHCQNPNLTCKVFVCPYLRKHSSFKIELNKLILVKVFFNRYQKIVLRNNFFIEKNRFLEKLKKDEHRIKPLILYYVDRDFLVYKHVPKDKKETAKKYEEEYKRTKGLRQR
ncbi:MAG TPA: hypothetical protein DEP51_05055 [Clostridiales bacterium]|nr:hypothetical protein [Clostridiales bacterium]